MTRMALVGGCGQPIPIFGGLVGRPAWIVDQQCIGGMVVAACSSTLRFGRIVVVAAAFGWMPHTCLFRSFVRCADGVWWFQSKRVSECESRDALESNRTKTVSTTQTQREREPQTQLWNVGATTNPKTVVWCSSSTTRLETRNFSWRSFYQSRCVERYTALGCGDCVCRHERRG